MLEEVSKILHRQAFTWRQRILFLRQLALVLQSGLPLLQAMELLRRRLDKNLQLVCLHLYQLLRHGSSLAEAMEREPSFFPQLTTQLVQAGELSGQLGTVLAELADYYEQQEKLRLRVRYSMQFLFRIVEVHMSVGVQCYTDIRMTHDVL